MGKTKEKDKIIKKKCRTCFTSTKGLQLLTKPAHEGAATTTEEPKTYAEILEEVTRINIANENESKFPKQICSNCIRKLTAAYDFVKQAHEVNKELWNMLSIAETCLEEYQIEYPVECELNTPRIKLENNNEEQRIVGDDNEDDKLDIDDKILIGDSNNEKDLTTISEDDLPLCEVKLKIEQDDEPIDPTEFSEKKPEATDNNAEEPVSLPKELSNLPFNDNAAEEDSLHDDDNYAMDYSSLDDKTDDDYGENNHEEKKPKARKRKQKKSNEETQDEDIPVPCDVCNKIFQNSKELSRHRRISHVPEDARCTCPICGNSFTRSGNMYSHMRKMHGEDSVKSILTERKRCEKNHECEQCNKKFTRKSHLKYHIESKHSNKEEENLEKEKEKQPERALCPFCGSSYSSNSHLIIHMRKHTGERPFQCDLCERAFPRVADLTTHRRIHTGEKPFSCKLCGKAFRVSNKLKNHLRSHTDERPYKCTDCDRAFKYSKDLNIHYRIHTGERPYSCGVCGSTFTQSNSLKAHRTKLGHMGDENTGGDKKTAIVNLSVINNTPVSVQSVSQTSTFNI